MLELKQSNRSWVERGAPWDATQFDAIDAEILTVFRRSVPVTPDDVRKLEITLNESMRRFRSPTRAPRGPAAVRQRDARRAERGLSRT